MKGKDKLTLLCVVLAIEVLSFVLGMLFQKHISEDKDAPDVTITTSVDTAKSVAPEPVRTIPAGSVTVPVKLALPEPDEPDLPENTILIFPPARKDTAGLQYKPDTAFSDTLRAVVPLTQKTFNDSNYTAYVSGFMPKLDSIEVRSKVITYTKTVTKYHRFNVGLTGGVGYGVFNKKPDVFVGVGVTWNLFGK